MGASNLTRGRVCRGSWGAARVWVSARRGRGGHRAGRLVNEPAWGRPQGPGGRDPAALTPGRWAVVRLHWTFWFCVPRAVTAPAGPRHCPRAGAGQAQQTEAPAPAALPEAAWAARSEYFSSKQHGEALLAAVCKYHRAFGDCPGLANISHNRSASRELWREGTGESSRALPQAPRPEGPQLVPPRLQMPAPGP